MQPKYIGKLDILDRTQFPGDSLQEVIGKIEKFLGCENQLVTWQLSATVWAVFRSQKTLNRFKLGHYYNNMPLGTVFLMEDPDDEVTQP